jgi:predicted site-specific integrase-resolvase
MKKMLSIEEVSLILGVSISTLRRWDKKGKLKPKYRTFGNQRMYLFEDIINILEPNTCKKERLNILYSRVSSKGQENDLKYQK